ncbi:MAG: hypothetical protein AAFX05_07910 [Planctomycetota bacterium]
MRTTIRLVAVLSCALMASSNAAGAQAVFPVEVDVTTGAFAGSYTGTISVDESFIPAIGGVTLRASNSDLTVMFDFVDGAGAPFTFDEMDDDSAPGFPAFFLTDGAPVSLDYRVPGGVAANGFQFFTDGRFIYGGQGGGEGTYTILPAPSSASLVLLGGVLAVRRRR